MIDLLLSLKLIALMFQFKDSPMPHSELNRKNWVIKSEHELWGATLRINDEARG